MADAREFVAAEELWENLKALSAETDALADLLTLDSHQPVAATEYVRCAECGVLWRNCPEVLRVAGNFGITVGVGQPCPYAGPPRCLLDVRTHYHYSARPGDPEHVVRYGSAEDRSAYPPNGLGGRR